MLPITASWAGTEAPPLRPLDISRSFLAGRSSFFAVSCDDGRLSGLFGRPLWTSDLPSWRWTSGRRHGFDLRRHVVGSAIEALVVQRLPDVERVASAAPTHGIGSTVKSECRATDEHPAEPVPCLHGDVTRNAVLSIRPSAMHIDLADQSILRLAAGRAQNVQVQRLVDRPIPLKRLDSAGMARNSMGFVHHVQAAEAVHDGGGAVGQATVPQADDRSPLPTASVSSRQLGLAIACMTAATLRGAAAAAQGPVKPPRF